MDITVSDEVSQEYHALVKNILCNREFFEAEPAHPLSGPHGSCTVSMFLTSWFIAQEAGM